MRSISENIKINVHALKTNSFNAVTDSYTFINVSVKSTSDLRFGSCDIDMATI